MRILICSGEKARLHRDALCVWGLCVPDDVECVGVAKVLNKGVGTMFARRMAVEVYIAADRFVNLFYRHSANVGIAQNCAVGQHADTV